MAKGETSLSQGEQFLNMRQAPPTERDAAKV
jgi:hypothetical protein